MKSLILDTTIFLISDNQKLKKIHGSFILNTKDSIYWGIKFITINKDIIILKDLNSYNDLDRIDSLSKIKVQKLDSLKNIIQLSRREFKKMLALKHFGFEQKFLKIKNKN